jgi:hypothetical protein
MVAVSEVVARVEDHCRQLGMEGDHPLRLALVTAVEASETARKTAEAAREAVQNGARGLTPEGEVELVRKVCETVTESTYAEAGRIARRIAGGLALKAGAVGVALLVVGLVVGRLTAPDAQARAMESAGFFAQVAETNDPRALRDYCQKHRVEQAGGVACELMVWVKPPSK